MPAQTGLIQYESQMTTKIQIFETKFKFQKVGKEIEYIQKKAKLKKNE